MGSVGFLLFFHEKAIESEVGGATPHWLGYIFVPPSVPPLEFGFP